MTTTRNKQTKTLITLFNESGIWILNCDDHDQCCEFDSKRQALECRPYPSNFCTDCATIVYGERTEWTCA
jgi:hypothetical protein